MTPAEKRRAATLLIDYLRVAFAHSRASEIRTLAAKLEADALAGERVPREPTEAMIEVGCDTFLARNEERFVIFAADVVAVWTAMYDASRAEGEDAKPSAAEGDG
jgi:hypothetical protein